VDSHLIKSEQDSEAFGYKHPQPESYKKWDKWKILEGKMRI